jgi:hypothetical protein
MTFDLEFARKVARMTAFAVARFDPTFCGKVIRITATVSVIEFLVTVALVMMWVPANSKCHSWQGPGLIVALLIPSGGAAFWSCVLAIFWTYIAKWISEWESLRPRWMIPASTALWTAVFVGFAAFVAVPFMVILQECGS